MASSQAIACAGSSAGMMPSSRDSSLERRHRLVVGDRHVSHPPAVAQVRVLGARHPGSRGPAEIECASRIWPSSSWRTDDSAPCSTPSLPGRERGAVAAAVEAFAACLDADQLDRLVADEGGERADRVAAAADAGDHAVRQARRLLQHLRARLVADHALQVAHQRRVGRRPDGRPDHVVRRRDVRDPVADRGADRLLEGACAGLDRLDGRAQQVHALDVGLLAAHVLGAHVDDALEAQQRAGRRGRDAVLTGAGLGDDARLAHPLCEQRLAQRVVDLVGAGVAAGPRA